MSSGRSTLDPSRKTALMCPSYHPGNASSDSSAAPYTNRLSSSQFFPSLVRDGRGSDSRRGRVIAATMATAGGLAAAEFPTSLSPCTSGMAMGKGRVVTTKIGILRICCRDKFVLGRTGLGLRHDGPQEHLCRLGHRRRMAVRRYGCVGPHMRPGSVALRTVLQQQYLPRVICRPGWET